MFFISFALLYHLDLGIHNVFDRLDTYSQEDATNQESVSIQENVPIQKTLFDWNGIDEISQTPNSLDFILEELSI